MPQQRRRKGRRNWGAKKRSKSQSATATPTPGSIKRKNENQQDDMEIGATKKLKIESKGDEDDEIDDTEGEDENQTTEPATQESSCSLDVLGGSDEISKKTTGGEGVTASEEAPLSENDSKIAAAVSETENVDRMTMADEKELETESKCQKTTCAMGTEFEFKKGTGDVNAQVDQLVKVTVIEVLPAPAEKVLGTEILFETPDQETQSTQNTNVDNLVANGKTDQSSALISKTETRSVIIAETETERGTCSKLSEPEPIQQIGKSNASLIADLSVEDALLGLEDHLRKISGIGNLKGRSFVQKLRLTFEIYCQICLDPATRLGLELVKHSNGTNSFATVSKSGSLVEMFDAMEATTFYDQFPEHTHTYLNGRKYLKQVTKLCKAYMDETKRFLGAPVKLGSTLQQ